MEDNIKQYNEKDMQKLKGVIREKNEEIIKEITEALANGDDNSYKYLKSLQLQCEAELRVIRHIENEFKEQFIVC